MPPRQLKTLADVPAFDLTRRKPRPLDPKSAVLDEPSPLLEALRAYLESQPS